MDELVNDLGELRALVESIAPVNSALEGHADSLVRRYVMIRRRFDYAAFVVALYASFEKFVESLVVSYVRLIAGRLPYKGLPPKLLTRHRDQTLDLLTRGRLGKGRYEALRELDVLKNLYECLHEVMPYTLNEEAVVAHDGNLHPKEINELFAVLGIEHMCGEVRRADALLDWYCTSEGIAQPPEDGVPLTMIEKRIEDLVGRRNQVAHRGGNPLNLLGHAEMLDAMGFIDALSRSVFARVAMAHLKEQHAQSGGAMVLSLREGPFQEGRVVVVGSPARRLQVGQALFSIDSVRARWGRIESLELNGKSVDAVEPREGVQNGVGVGLSFRFPRRATLYALDVDDDLVWSPPTP